MNLSHFIRSSILRYRRFYSLVGLSVAVCVAVMTGSLVVGDSVKASLERKAREHLFGTRSVVIDAGGYLGTDALKDLSLGEESHAVMLSEGFVSREGRLIPVTVWGMDTLPGGEGIPEGSIFLNRKLLGEIGSEEDPYLVLRLPHEGLVPSSSLFVTGRYSTSLRLHIEGAIGADEGGNLSLRNSQATPLNVFINRGELCDALGLGDVLNVILSPRDITREELYSLSPSTLGLRMEEDRIVSDGIFLKGGLVDRISASAQSPNRLYSYLVNSIEGEGGKRIPYSFATALDYWKGEPLPEDGAILSDYSARRLGLARGDSVKVGYFVSDALKNLSERFLSFRVERIVPLEELLGDAYLSADFPGLADASSCTDWDSDLPIDMGRITHEDETYWEKYRSTPKILLPYSTMRREWGNSWGEATQIRTTSKDALSVVSVEDFPVSVVQPADKAIRSARGGVDFSGLFLALGFFIILGALLLINSPLGEMYFVRREELRLLSEMGFPRRKITGILLREVAPVAALGSLAGIALGVIYALGVVFLLGNLWSGATHADGLSLYPKTASLVEGAVAGLLLGGLVIYLAARRATSPERTEGRIPDVHSARLWAILCTVLLALCFILGFAQRQYSVIIFILVGCLSLGCGLLWIRAILAKGSPDDSSRRSLVLQSLRHRLREVLSGMTTLSIGVFITFAVGLNRQDFSKDEALSSPAGDFNWWCELSVPLQHDISTPEGRARMSLSALGEDARVMQLSLVGGDDASCLNLNKVETPAILGFNPAEWKESSFRVSRNIFSTKDQETILRRMEEGETLYGLVDETVLEWGLMLSPGDTLHYLSPTGSPLDVVIAGTLPNTVFQGYVLIPGSKVERFWGRRGSSILLARSGNEGAGTLLETALNEYGTRVSACRERLLEMGSVTDTYLTIFLMLGIAGLLLGILSFAVGVRKALEGRRREISTLGALGLGDKEIQRTLLQENALPAIWAILLGAICATLSILSSFGAIAPWTWTVCITTTLLFILLVLLFVGRMSREYSQNTNYEDSDD